ncbi:hypothetical protein Q757_07720 [Oenococcus alcoholitolerans]|uniref:Uncharacterized protein n=1 Tax=Oenococcus alcoholitolerans TaxID=931074 RepID=A0ABR4XPK6_9LACO|nr:hypothetical protein Q757_07720 [Oenococcus alcoholitolerans]
MLCEHFPNKKIDFFKISQKKTQNNELDLSDQWLDVSAFIQLTSVFPTNLWKF